MTALLTSLRGGGFLTRERILVWSCLLLAGFAAAIAYLFATRHGLNDYAGRPLGSDFSSFYAAGHTTLGGGSAYDQAALYRTEQSIFGAQTPYFAFAYPPLFLLLAVPLATAPYLAALALWQLGTLSLYLLAMRLLRLRLGAGVPGGAPFVAVSLAFTATFVNLTHGQNGFLTAALFAAALALLETSGVLAGICFGLIAYKPQLGILIPFALAAGGHWRSFVSASVTVVALCALALLLFGAQSWEGFFAAAHFSQTEILDQNAVGYFKMVSLFAALRLWHLPLPLAYGAQALAALGVVAATIMVWRSAATLQLRGAILCLGTLLITPFALDYDLMLLAPAILLLAMDGKTRGFAPFEGAALALLWLVPVAARGIAQVSLIPLGLLATGWAFILLARRLPERG